MNQKGIAIVPILIVIFLVLGILVTTQLTKIQQIFKSRASEVTTPFYAQVTCDNTGKATFSWNDIPEAAEYIVNVPRTANTPQAGMETGRRTYAVLQLLPGVEYPDWEIKVGLKTGGYQTFDQKEFSCTGMTSGEVPARLLTIPIAASVTCASSGQATFSWGAYPQATNYKVGIYTPSGRTVVDAGTANSVTANLTAGASYPDWELVVRLPDDEKVFDQLEFKCDGTQRGETTNPVAITYPPSNLRASCQGSTQVDLSWNAAVRNGTTVANYIVNINKTPLNSFTPQDANSGDSQVTIGPTPSHNQAVQANTSYDFSILARFADGTTSSNVQGAEFRCQ